MSHVNDNNDLMKRLAEVWRRSRRFASVRGSCIVLLSAIALLAVNFLLDWMTDLTSTGRLMLLAVNILILAAVGYWTWWRNLLSYDPVMGALEVERAYPELGGLLVTYVQFHDKGVVHEGASPTLVAAMLHQAEERTRAVPFNDVVRFGSIWKLYLSVLAVFCVVACIVGVYPGFARVFFVRMLNPFSIQRYPTRTVIDEISGDLVVQHGRSVLLRAVVSGELPDETMIRFQPPGEAVDTIHVRTGESINAKQRVFSHEIKEAFRDFDYSFLAGDAISQTCRVQVVRAPDQNIQAEVAYPAYMGLEPLKVQMLSFEAPIGSTIDWSVAADRPLTHGRMILDDGQAVAVSLTADKQSGTVALTPKNSFSYGFEWTDGKTGFVFSPEVRYSVRMVPDQAPTIVLDSPVIEEKSTVWKAVDLAFSAKDDYGLASARLVYKVSRAEGDPKSEEETKEEILVFPKKYLETTESLKWRVRDSIPDLATGDMVSYAVEVLDRQPAPAGPGVGRSLTCRITIVSQEEYVKIAMEKRRRLLARIKNLHEEETVADKAIQSLLIETVDEND